MKKRSLLLSMSLIVCGYAIGQEIIVTTPGDSKPNESIMVISENPQEISSAALLQDTVLVEIGRASCRERV